MAGMLLYVLWVLPSGDAEIMSVAPIKVTTHMRARAHTNTETSRKPCSGSLRIWKPSLVANLEGTSN